MHHPESDARTVQRTTENAAASLDLPAVSSANGVSTIAASAIRCRWKPEGALWRWPATKTAVLRGLATEPSSGSAPLRTSPNAQADPGNTAHTATTRSTTDRAQREQGDRRSDHLAVNRAKRVLAMPALSGASQLARNIRGLRPRASGPPLPRANRVWSLGDPHTLTGPRSILPIDGLHANSELWPGPTAQISNALEP